MSNTNDQKILELKKQIEEKKGKVLKSKSFQPVTNCSLELDGARYNIQVLNTKEQILGLLVKLNCYALSAKDLGMIDEYMVSGYKATDWIIDLKAKLDFVNRKEEERKLKEMESKLDLWLSNEKKVELELNAIESMLKDS